MITIDWINLGGGRQPAKANDNDAGWDLFVSQTMHIAPGTIENVNTHIAINIPRGYFGHILSRSSVMASGSQVLPAVIDAGYQGSLYIRVLNNSTELVSVYRGQRIAQLVILPVPDIRWEQTEEFPPSERGTHGFGSSGR